MKKLIGVCILLLVSGFADAEKTYFYDIYNAKTAEIVGKFSRHIQLLSPNQIEVTIKWIDQNKANRSTQEATLDASYATQRWRVIDPKNDTDYLGEREGNLLLIQGRHNGQPVEKKIEIDSKPFFNNPSIGLEGFVRDGVKKMEFRTLRPDKLSQYKMKAENKGPETITVNGKKVEAIRVKWGLTGLRSKFYSQTLWFRKSDGVTSNRKWKTTNFQNWSQRNEIAPSIGSMHQSPTG